MTPAANVGFGMVARGGQAIALQSEEAVIDPLCASQLGGALAKRLLHRRNKVERGTETGESAVMDCKGVGTDWFQSGRLAVFSSYRHLMEHDPAAYVV